jgi:hypothetical protein
VYGAGFADQPGAMQRQVSDVTACLDDHVTTAKQSGK